MHKIEIEKVKFVDFIEIALNSNQIYTHPWNLSS